VTETPRLTSTVLGGYGRHRSKYLHSGWQGLEAELRLDVQRLWVRNLGRDDRLYADRSREVRAFSSAVYPPPIRTSTR